MSKEINQLPDSVGVLLTDWLATKREGSASATKIKIEDIVDFISKYLIPYASGLSVSYKGAVQSVSYNPGTPSTSQFWIAAPGTYTNFKDASNNPIVVPAVDSNGYPVILALLSFNTVDGFWTKVQYSYNILLALQINTSQIVDSAVTPIKTSFLIVGKNLFNINNTDATTGVKLGYYVAYNTGVATASASYNLTGFIKVSASTSYFLSYKNQIAWYDANRNYISGDNVVNAAGAAVSSPANAVYIRASVAIANWNNFQVELGTSGTTFETHRRVLKSSEYSIYANAVVVNGIDSAAISKGAITTEKLNFLVTGKNLFNILDADYATGFFVQAANGILAANAAYATTGYIPVTAGLQYAISPTTPSQQEAWFDSNKVFISGFTGSNSSTVVTAPANAAYLRCSVLLSTQLATFQVEQAAAATAYEQFKQVFKTPNTRIYADHVTPEGAAELQQYLNILTAQIANGAVTKDKVNFLIPGKNKFNVNDTGVQVGFYIDASGNVLSNASYNLTGYIPVLPSTIYTVSYKHTIGFYTAAKVFISSDGTNNNTVNKQITTPANAAYIRCTVSAATYWAVFQVEPGSSATFYEAYNLQLSDPSGTPISVPGSTIDVTAIQSVLDVNRSRSAKFAIAPKLYIPKTAEFSIYYENISKYFDEYRGRIDIVLTGISVGNNGLDNYRGRAVQITPAVTGSFTATINIYNERFDIIQTITCTVTISDPATSTAVKVLNIGDSYTLRSTWVNKLLASAGASGVTFLGLRVTNTGTSPTTTTAVNMEGRGGSALSTYLSQDYSLNGQSGIYMPFFQPTATYFYLGRTDFWISANTSNGDGTFGTYDSGAYAVRTQFNATTGFKISPNVNDLMYDVANAGYKYWNGTAWTTTSAPASWAFSFAKYRSGWGIAQPDIVHLLFGTNDWASVSETQIISQWSAWKANLDIVIASIRADSPNCKIVIGIPNPPGKTGAAGDIGKNQRRKRAFWYHASQIIANYSGQEVSNKVYISDYNAGVDREFGFTQTSVKPFADYSGTNRELLPSDDVHLNTDGMNQMGNYYLGIIQSLR